eukprot:394798_1
MSHQHAFSDFMTRIYKTFLDDYIHLVVKHSNSNDINSILMNCARFRSCSAVRCNFTARHQCIQRDMEHHENKNKNLPDSKLNFLIETMDSLHFYLFHLFDCGLRCIVNDDIYETDDDNTTENEYFDAEFCRLNKRIVQTQSVTHAFVRFNLNKNNKFKIIGYDDRNNFDGDTFLDGLFCHLVHQKVDNDYICKLRCFLEAEEYDSQAVCDDFGIPTDDENQCDGNLFYLMHDVQFLRNYIKATTVSSSSFDIGLRFYYWPHYEEMKAIPEKELIDHQSSDDIGSLIVEKKYSTFKEEILNYQYVSFHQYQRKILPKALYYENTKIVKRTTAGYTGLHYNITKGTQLSLPNLVSVILYTDYSDICTHFSATFRKITVFEVIKSIKNRNSNYWWMSKLLRETVEIYGHCRYGDNDGHG